MQLRRRRMLNMSAGGIHRTPTRITSTMSTWRRISWGCWLFSSILRENLTSEMVLPDKQWSKLNALTMRDSTLKNFRFMIENWRSTRIRSLLALSSRSPTSGQYSLITRCCSGWSCSSWDSTCSSMAGWLWKWRYSWQLSSSASRCLGRFSLSSCRLTLLPLRCTSSSSCC